jgi:RHS repeat-associated protein
LLGFIVPLLDHQKRCSGQGLWQEFIEGLHDAMVESLREILTRCNTNGYAYTMTYDVRNRLTQYSKSGVTSSYVQDFFGRRIKKTVGSTTTYFLWDGMRLLSEHNGSGVREKRYGYGSAGYAPWQLQDAAGTYWAHADRLEQPRLLTNSTGQVVWKATAAAYGSSVVQSDPDGNGTAIILNTRLPGQYWDSESGLHYNYFRDYDPQLGRYVQADPIGLAGGINAYVYVANSPVNGMDPQGLFLVLPLIPPAIEAAVYATAVVSAVAVVGYELYQDYKNGQMNSESGDKSQQSKPTDAPPGTKAIDKFNLPKDVTHGVKDQLGAQPTDWTGVAPNGDVITTDPRTGKAINHGPIDSYTQKPTGLCQ